MQGGCFLHWWLLKCCRLCLTFEDENLVPSTGVFVVPIICLSFFTAFSLASPSLHLCGSTKSFCTPETPHRVSPFRSQMWVGGTCCSFLSHIVLLPHAAIFPAPSWICDKLEAGTLGGNHSCFHTTRKVRHWCKCPSASTHPSGCF